MSDTMFFGVLRMPYELAMADEMSRLQFYWRAQEAADRLESAIPAEVGRRAMEALEVMSAHYSGSLDYQPAYVSLGRAAITELQQYLPAQEQGEKR